VTLGLAASKTGHPAEAAEAFGRAATADDFPASWLGLAAARTELGDRAGALDALDRALRLGSVQPAIAIGAADLYRRLGEPAKADEWVAAAIRDDARLAGDPNLPAGTSASAIVDPAIRDAGASTTGVLLAMEADRPQAARAIAESLASPDRERMIWVAAAWFGDPNALADLQQQLGERPLDLSLATWVGLIVHREHPAAAAPYIRWSDIVNATAGAGSKEIRTSTEGKPNAGTGFSSSFYGHYTYSRPTPWDLTPGGVVELVTR
jgi:tetratricopeptide (TPR) repeat protein